MGILRNWLSAGALVWWLAGLGLMGVSDRAIAASCDIFGGSTKGCQFPTAIRYYFGGKFFSSPEAAANHFVSTANQTPYNPCFEGKCNYGILSSAYQPQPEVSCYGHSSGCSGTLWTTWEVLPPGAWGGRFLLSLYSRNRLGCFTKYKRNHLTSNGWRKPHSLSRVPRWSCGSF